MQPNPAGRCLCGCGAPTLPATMTRRARGLVKGQPTRYVAGHNSTTAMTRTAWQRYQGCSTEAIAGRTQLQEAAADHRQQERNQRGAELQRAVVVPVAVQNVMSNVVPKESPGAVLSRPSVPSEEPHMLIAPAGCLLIPGIRFERPSPGFIPERQGLSIKPRRPSGAWMSGSGYGSPARPAYRP